MQQQNHRTRDCKKMNFFRALTAMCVYFIQLLKPAWLISPQSKKSCIIRNLFPVSAKNRCQLSGVHSTWIVLLAQTQEWVQQGTKSQKKLNLTSRLGVLVAAGLSDQPNESLNASIIGRMSSAMMKRMLFGSTPSAPSGAVLTTVSTRVILKSTDFMFYKQQPALMQK